MTKRSFQDQADLSAKKSRGKKRILESSEEEEGEYSSSEEDEDYESEQSLD